MNEPTNLGNGESEKMETAELEVIKSEIIDVDITMNEDTKPKPKFGKGKRKAKDGESPQKKKKKSSNFQQKNALMQLNELKPGLKYVVESQSGPPHNPQFEVSVYVNDQKYIGRGNSKQLAKHAAAQAALSSFVQFRNTPEAMNVINQPSGMSDFTMDNDENEGCNFNKFEVRKNGAEEEILISSGAPALKADPLKILTEADKKNPVMLLNEIHPGLTYNLLEENANNPTQRFRMSVEIEGKMFEGTGQNKKLAKASTARAVLCNLYNVSYSLFPKALTPSGDADLFSFPQPVADKIAKQLMSTFNDVMSGIPEYTKWKVIACIAMTKDVEMEDAQVVGFGTGTKCINGEHISMCGANINDCHAEIISRRCLKDFFYTHLELLIEGEAEESIFMKREKGGFCLKPFIKFHLYISTAPCGDARIFSPHEENVLDAVDRHPNRNSRGVLRTKIESGEGTIPVKGGQCIQTWDSILPGQDRLLTMSCSDKIASWNVLGVQGALLSHFIEPIYLDSVILGGLFHPNHLRRALFGRIEEHVKDLPPLYRVNKPKMCATTSPEMRHLSKSPNFSVNWSVDLARPEVVNATTGKTESGQVSRLAKRNFFQRFINIYDRLSHIDTHPAPQTPLYGAFKSAVKSYKEAQKALEGAFVAAGLGHWVKKPVEQNQFEHN